jgi:hypothetical protein
VKVVIAMSRCPICQNEYDTSRFGQLCPKCSAAVLAKDTYSAQDTRFVSILAGVLIAAVLSMPGAFVGHFVGEWFNAGTRGTTIGVLIFSVIGLILGYRLGTSMIRRSQAARGIRG